MAPVAPRAALTAALIVLAACADRPTPLEPAQVGPPVSAGSPSLELARNERLARRLAVALRDDDFRALVARALASSPEREGKVHLQRFLDGNLGAVRHRLALLAGDSEADISADLAASPDMEIYLPVPAHRAAWRGSINVVVATAEGDRDRPIAFDPSGRRHLLDADRPPATPVIALGRAESRFTEGSIPYFDGCITCDVDPDGGGFTGGDPSSGGTTTGPGASLLSAGLYMTYAKFNQTFEGWLKGDPEFEVHILGQDGSSSAMKSYQCAGQTAGAPYAFDQNATEWSGSVLLFSQAQLDSYKTQHPGQAVRVFVIEDDDGACVIKTDSARVAKLFQQLVTTYGDLTGGKDTTLLSIKTFKKAVSLLQLFKAVWSLITTQDDVVGNAIEDVVAREYSPNANWIVKGENTITNGAIRLEMH
ncbi:MAG TPA: hypothetical protein VFU23_03790 [Gemmatimonadales bacterium]|nr:hypothetical protein [Gemmatimonadales bacterium]